MSIRHLLVAAATTALVLPLAASPAPAHPPTSDADAAAATAVAWQRIAVRTIFTEALTPPAAGGLYMAFTSRAVDDAAKDVLRRGGSARAAVATAAARRARGVLRHDVHRQPRRRPGQHARGRARRTRREQGRPDRREGRRPPDREPRGRRAQRPDPDLLAPDEVGYWQPPEVADPPGAAWPWPGSASSTRWCRSNRPRSTDRTRSPAMPTPSTTRRCWRPGSSTPTPDLADEALTAQFFAFNPLVMYRLAVCDMLTDSPLGLRDTTRLFATSTPPWRRRLSRPSRLKFEVGFWRPFQAINDLRDDGNPATAPQPGWAPLVPNPSTPTTPAATRRRPRRSPR